jgi:hypothetical protein
MSLLIYLGHIWWYHDWQYNIFHMIPLEVLVVTFVLLDLWFQMGPLISFIKQWNIKDNVNKCSRIPKGQLNVRLSGLTLCRSPFILLWGNWIQYVIKWWKLLLYIDHVLAIIIEMHTFRPHMSLLIYLGHIWWYHDWQYNIFHMIPLEVLVVTFV